ncbi:MAG: hypothetical protein JO306_03210, partial [Gemmatimonadetes bacterium]|nr:hypothetical protein [Gemmatimonadota bacterium]
MIQNPAAVVEHPAVLESGVDAGRDPHRSRARQAERVAALLLTFYPAAASILIIEDLLYD